MIIICCGRSVMERMQFRLRGSGLTVIFFSLLAGIVAGVILVSCKSPENSPHLRPAYHFTAQENWINDPNGLVYLDGEYHLFYQYNPFGNKWGHMSWGHAVSRDLVRWKELPVALEEEGPCFYPTMMFSGSAVIDDENTSGLCGKNISSCMTAVYTSFTLLEQTQSIAVSVDRGRTFVKYSRNPVLDIDVMHFRDPKVFRHEATERWIMAVSLPKERKVRFYSSTDLKTWKHLSDFGPAGFPEGIWECPDLFRLPVKDGKGTHKWVLVTSLGENGPGPDMQYFIGEFDGEKFINDNAPDLGLRLDHGYDYYAAVSWNNIPAKDGRTIMIGWLNNWKYANDIPTHPWKGAMSLPREVGLVRTPEGLRLTQKPVRETAALRNRSRSLKNISVDDEYTLPNPGGETGGSLEIRVRFSRQKAREFGLYVCKGADNATVIGYDTVTEKLFVERSHSGDDSFSEEYGTMSRAEVPVAMSRDALELHVFIDNSIVEVFAGDGRAVITCRIFPGPDDRGIALYSRGGAITVSDIEIYALKSAL